MYLAILRCGESYWRKIIDLFMKLHGGGNKQKRDYLIKRFDFDPKKKAKGYSKGNRQKVGLIAALSVDSDLYIFDEPTSGLDPLMEAIFQEEVERLRSQENPFCCLPIF